MGCVGGCLDNAVQEPDFFMSDRAVLTARILRLATRTSNFPSWAGLASIEPDVVYIAVFTEKLPGTSKRTRPD